MLWTKPFSGKRNERISFSLANILAMQDTIKSCIALSNGGTADCMTSTLKVCLFGVDSRMLWLVRLSPRRMDLPAQKSKTAR